MNLEKFKIVLRVGVRRYRQTLTDVVVEIAHIFDANWAMQTRIKSLHQPRFKSRARTNLE
jgi:hypothetical protein